MSFIKNITSKDIQLSKNTIKELIASCNLEEFNMLCEKADFIFPFLKERIANDFVNLINKENLKTVFEFSKIYCPDFEDLIIKSWLKFATEDLTDEILEIFENGTNEQKAYCAKYFSYIQDPLSLEFLNKEAKSEFEPLKINCAQTLSKFGDTTVLDEMKKVVLTSEDDFEKLSAFNFISAYQNDEQIKFVLENLDKCAFGVNIISSLLDYNELSKIKNVLSKKDLIVIFLTLINAYPEDISLDTISYYQIYDFIELLKSFNNQFAINALLIAKAKFNEFSENDIYSFDLDKNLKEELKNIVKLLNSYELKIDDLDKELEERNSKESFNCALDVILEYQLKEYYEKLVSIFNNEKIEEEFYASIAQILKSFNKIELLDKKVIENIENENIRALIEAYLAN